MLRFFFASLLLTGLIASCTPRTSTVAGISAAPILIKASESAQRGGTLTLQGRYLGGPSVARVLLGANEDGQGAYAVPTIAVKSWTDTEIVVEVPAEAPVGGAWVFVEVGGKLSTGLRISVRE